VCTVCMCRAVGRSALCVCAMAVELKASSSTTVESGEIPKRCVGPERVRKWSLRPIWVPDGPDSAPRCPGCDLTFTIFFRRVSHPHVARCSVHCTVRCGAERGC
jgi:hypothetical protein